MLARCTNVTIANVTMHNVGMFFLIDWNGHGNRVRCPSSIPSRRVSRFSWVLKVLVSSFSRRCFASLSGLPAVAFVSVGNLMFDLLSVGCEHTGISNADQH